MVLYGLVGTLDVERGRDVDRDGEDVLVTDFLLRVVLGHDLGTFA